MRALVTGGNGFVGTHLVRALRARGDDVVVAGRVAAGAPVDVALEVADAANVRAAVASARPDVVFHLAAQAFVPESTRDPLATYATNALGTAHLIEALRADAARARDVRLVVVSSAEVYGVQEPSAYPLRETIAPRPATPYAASKLAAEAIALASASTYGIPVVVARAFNHIGPGQSDRFVVAGFARQLARIAAGGPPQLYVGNLSATRDFLDVRDVASAYIALAERGLPGNVYNVCSGVPRTIADMLRSLIAIARVPVEVREDPERLRPSDVPLFYGSNDKVRAATGWTPALSLAQTLRDVYDDARERDRVAS